MENKIQDKEMLEALSECFKDPSPYLSYWSAHSIHPIFSLTPFLLHYPDIPSLVFFTIIKNAAAFYWMKKLNLSNGLTSYLTKESWDHWTQSPHVRNNGSKKCLLGCPSSGENGMKCPPERPSSVENVMQCLSDSLNPSLLWMIMLRLDLFVCCHTVQHDLKHDVFLFSNVNQVPFYYSIFITSGQQHWWPTVHTYLQTKFIIEHLGGHF